MNEETPNPYWDLVDPKEKFKGLLKSIWEFEDQTITGQNSQKMTWGWYWYCILRSALVSWRGSSKSRSRRLPEYWRHVTGSTFNVSQGNSQEPRARKFAEAEASEDISHATVSPNESKHLSLRSNVDRDKPFWDLVDPEEKFKGLLRSI